MIVNLSQNESGNYRSDSKAKILNEKQKKLDKKKGHPILKSCIFFTIIIIAGLGFLFHRYFSLFSSVGSITGQTLKQQVKVNTQKIIYNNGKLINILALGSDNDQKFQGGNPLTQTMIIISINPSNNNVNIISIPRDSYVSIPKIGYNKIDTAAGFGGIPLAIQTVEEDYGIKVDHYAWIGLDGFIKVIDTFGGVDIDVSQPVLDEQYPMDLTGVPSQLYASQRLYIPAGSQHLNGTSALMYVRSRHGNLGGDFTRSQRQQELLLTMKDKLSNDSLISQLPTLFSELSGSIKTDMTLLDLTQLSKVAKSIQSTDIHQYVLLPPTYGATGQTNGMDVVNPDWSAIQALFKHLFTTQ